MNESLNKPAWERTAVDEANVNLAHILSLAGAVVILLAVLWLGVQIERWWRGR